MKLKRRVLKCTECEVDIIDIYNFYEIEGQTKRITAKAPEIYASVRAHFLEAHGDEHFNFIYRIGCIDAVNEYEPEDIGSGEDM